MTEPREWLADELERLFGETKNSSGLIGSLVYGNMPTVLAALRSPGLDRDGERMRERCARACDARSLGCKTAAQEWAEGSINFPPQPEIAHAFITAADQCRQLAETIRAFPLAHEEKAGC